MRIINKIKRYLSRRLKNIFRNSSLKIREKKWNNFLNSKENSILFKKKNLFKIKLYKDSELSKYIFQKQFENEELEFVRSFLPPKYFCKTSGTFTEPSSF